MPSYRYSNNRNNPGSDLKADLLTLAEANAGRSFTVKQADYAMVRQGWRPTQMVRYYLKQLAAQNILSVDYSDWSGGVRYGIKTLRFIEVFDMTPAKNI